MTTEIHPSAIIDPKAVIGAGTKIGPYCVIGAEVVLGEGCFLHNHVTLAGPTTIGDHNIFYPYGSIGGRSQDLKYSAEPTFLKIGDHNSFREFVTINRATAPHGITKIGNHGNFLAYTHIGHDCVIGDHVIFSNNTTLGGHVLIEDHVVIGGLSGVHQFCRIGEYGMIGGITKIVQDVPAFMIADGNPAAIRGINQVGLERAHFSASEIRDLREAYKFIFRKGYNTTQAVELLREKYSDSFVIKKLVDFIAASKRGIVR
ncbi:MAG: acyl-ACP--UDP-N-acetylglucosamine O-acyltransferase [Chthoniobacterales bacterium]|nr:acyl-ACP--UDP-N-acetylglucosamine O-acyltransferase [Chthoniobacterales bacterium]